MGGGHHGLDCQRKEAEKDGRRAGRGSVGFGVAFSEVHALPDGGNAEEQEDDQRQDGGVYHRVHGHGTAAQGARDEDVDEADHHACYKDVQRVTIGFACALDEHDRGADTQYAEGDPNQGEQNVQPLERRERSHAFIFRWK